MSVRWLSGKVAAAALTLLFVIVFNFFLFRVMGDPTDQLARLPRATPEEIQKLRGQYGLDKPMLGQFTDYMGDTARLDFGISQRSRRTVTDEIKDALPWTLLLVGTGTLLATLLGSWMGVKAATRRGKHSDQALLGFNLFTYASPEYWIGIILILVFAVNLKWFPASGMWAIYGGGDLPDLLRHLFLPAVTLAVVATGVIARLTRTAMLEVLRQDFIRTARAKGVTENTVIYKHAFKAALVTVIPVIGI